MELFVVSVLLSVICCLNAQMLCPKGETPLLGPCQPNVPASCPSGSLCREVSTNSPSYRTLCCRPLPTTNPPVKDKIVVKLSSTTQNAIRKISQSTTISGSGTSGVAELETCPPNSFLCGNGKCIPSAWMCDNDRDCPAGEDESDSHCKTCRPNHIRVCLPLVPLNGDCVIHAQCLNKSSCIMNKCSCPSGLIHVNGDCQVNPDQ